MNPYGMILIAFLILVGCSHIANKPTALSAHQTAEKVKDDWQKVEKPLEIVVVDRSKEELEAMGSFTVWLDGTAKTTGPAFHFNGESFQPTIPILADSAVHLQMCYPYQPGLHPADTVRVGSSPNGRLVGIVQSTESFPDKIRVKMKIQEITALLRIRLQSDAINDILTSMSLCGSRVTTSGLLMPLRGEWLETYPTGIIHSMIQDCLLNNGHPHDFHLVPTEQADDVTITLKVNGREFTVSTTLPPLRAGSITELRLKLHNGKLAVGSSWVDSKYPFEKRETACENSVKVGYYLQRDGSVSPQMNEHTLAWVIEVNGRHGKAVAMEDNSTCNWFGKKSFRTGHIFETADGKLKEGYFNQADTLFSELSDNGMLVFSPRIKYPDVYALGYSEGAMLTQEILNNATERAFKNFCDKRVLASAYIPSLAEMAKLAYMLEANEDKLPTYFKKPTGTYTTSCESGEDTFYSIDMSDWFITAFNSKEHSDLKTRLFYLF